MSQKSSSMQTLQFVPLAMKSNTMMKTVTGDQTDLKIVNPRAAAIGIGSTMHMAAANPDSDDMLIRTFGTFT